MYGQKTARDKRFCTRDENGIEMLFLRKAR